MWTHSPRAVPINSATVNPPLALLAKHVRPDDAPRLRLDQAATDVFTTWLPSRATAKRACKRGDVLVGGLPAEPSRWVGPGDQLALVERHETAAATFELPLDVLYEDRWMAVVWKPPGYRTSGNLHQTIGHALPYNLTASDAADALTCPQPAHRLDAPTQGLLVCAKTSHAMMALHRAFAARDVQKTYTAIVVGALEGEHLLTSEVDGKDAETRVVAKAQSRSLRTSWITEVEAMPHTGRTHQIRRHLARLGHPIMGDTIYGERQTTLRGLGLFLAATSVSIPHPVLDKRVTVCGEVPAKFRSLQRRESRRWNDYSGAHRS
ncbi:MAG: RluA family pseudouridine synthase [Myxococcota bacterium]|jgi:RluA family pseudouridine synthase